MNWFDAILFGLILLVMNSFAKNLFCEILLAMNLFALNLFAQNLFCMILLAMDLFDQNLFCVILLAVNMFLAIPFGVNLFAANYEQVRNEPALCEQAIEQHVHCALFCKIRFLMIVHILPPTNGFPAVSYNTNKVDRNKGELMKVSGFGALQGLHQVRPEDYRHHFAMVSATNKHVKRPQFHIVISAEGKSYDKHRLTTIGEEWLKAMGYEKQPYLIIFHKDTANNHVHLVTTRIDRSGRKISDRFEKIRAVAELNRIMGVGLDNNAKNDIENALAFRFATEAQFRMILESKGYVLRERDGQFQLIKFGKVLGSIGRIAVTERLAANVIDEQRKIQIKAWFHKYATVYTTAPEKTRNAYRSEFSDFLKSSFGIELIFHASGDKPPYGYSIIDHAGKNVFKGSEIIPLKQLLLAKTGNSRVKQKNNFRNAINPAQLDYYAAILKAALYNYPDLRQGLYHQGLVVFRQAEAFTLHDPSAGVYMDTKELLDQKDQEVLIDRFSQEQETGEEIYRQHHYIPDINLASDIDDEVIHGRNRRRIKKARTNSR